MHTLKRKEKKISAVEFEMVPRRCPSRRRSRSEVIVNILSEALGGVNKTRLMYRCNLNFVRFSRYLQELLDAGLIERVHTNPEGIVVYKTTDKGRELLRVLRKVEQLMASI